MTFTALFTTLFLVAFAIIGGVVMFLSRTIDHGEARFDSDGQQITDEPEQDGTARSAQRLDTTDTPRQVNNNE